MKQALGSFDVTVTPLDVSAVDKEAGRGRMSFTKVISGDMVGSTQGEMLTTATPSTGALAYVALETVHATLSGHTGSFVFLHGATMNKQDPTHHSLHIYVVPGSGTDGLTGIRGDFTIHIDSAGKHTYTFDYELP